MKKYVIKGDIRSGKTYSAKHLIQELENKNSLVLSTECIKESSPYDAFFNLLDNIFEVDLFNRREKNEVVNQAIEMIGSFALGPLAKFINGKSDNSFSKDDNLDFIDKASEELLEYLLNELKEYGNLIFVFTCSREKTYLQSSKLIEIQPLQQAEQMQFLKTVFHLSDEVVKWIIDWVSDNKNVYAPLLVDIVKNLYKNKYLEKQNSIYVFSNNFNKNNPTIPDSIKEELEGILKKYPEYHKYFELSSLIGKDFDARILAEILNKSLLELIKTLDDIAKNTHLIEDKYSKDNFYSFKSQLFLETFRNIFHYSNDSSLNPIVSQLIRFYHKEIADKMIKYDYKYTQIANHLHSAGLDEIKRAIEYQLKAADYCKKIFQFKDAYMYIDRAKELSKYENEYLDIIKEKELILQADENFVRGHFAADFTDKLIKKLQEDADEVTEEFKIAAIRSIYNSGKIDRAYFVKTTEIAEKYLITSKNKTTQAQGYHFAALGLDNSFENKDKKTKYFEKALEFAKDNKELWAQIANSYAGYLSFCTDEEKKYAKKLYLKSEKIKQRLPIKDLPGLARTYGGLGRLALFSNPCDCKEAIEYLNKDLDISQDLKDNFGISNMYSMLGMAYRLKNDCKTAIDYYNKSLNMKHNSIDIFASVFGKIACNEDAYEEAKKYIKKFGNPPSFTYSFLDDSQKEKLGLK